MQKMLWPVVVAAAITQGCSTMSETAVTAAATNEAFVAANSGGVLSGSGDCLRSVGWSSEQLIVECTASSTPVAEVAPTPTLARVSFDGRALFPFDSAELTTLGRLELNSLVSKLKRHGGIGSIDVVGHADSIGSSDYNQSLSERRAATVRSYLESTLSNVEVKASGMGETLPVADNVSDAGRQKNRRVEVNVDAMVQQ